MPNLNWHEYLLFVSFVGSIAGLFLLSAGKPTQVDELEETEQILLTMSFTYWIVYCVVVGILKFSQPEWDILLMSLKLTAAFSYLLTFTSVLTLPLHRMSVRQVE
ncbi:hypothetical protein [Coleofasciculus sp. H7-2]|uniref:hypothetical protein n=1 Tax=Coleofasciculus sp. H7-2 TaxID=3351545 RepID=UPI0036712C09